MSSICSVTTLVTDRLQELFGDMFGDFKRALQSCNAIIAGSFITQSILKETWPDSDVDIYVPVKMNCHLTKKTDLYYVYDGVLGGKKYYSDAGYLITEIEKFLYENSSHHDNDGYYEQGCYFDDLGPSLCGMRTYMYLKSSDKTKTMNGGTKVQVMQINTDGLPIERFICDTFDFDICKCYYQIIQNREMVSCVNLNAILSKTCDFSYGISPRNTNERYKKYVKRGFKFLVNGKIMQEGTITTVSEMIYLFDHLRRNRKVQ